jgi:mRNA-degrading endonuclease RelE of RelBE toxin-antitoxin system
MSWSVSFAARGLRDLSTLEPAEAHRVIKALKQCLGDPFRVFDRLAGEPAAFRMRVGDLRVVAALDEGTKVIDVVSIGHRSTVYDR